MPSTFNRYEKKYLVTKDMKEKILEELQGYIKQDDNASSTYYTICNIYYDTKDNEIIKRSVSKPIFKQKLRLRCYLSSGNNDIVFLEIKKKVNGFVNKRRTNITISEANNLIFNKVMPVKKDYHNIQVLNEIYYYVVNRDLEATISINYDRCAYFGIENSDFRLTFDNHITSRRENVYMGRDDQDNPIIDENLCIMELKTSMAIPLYMTEILTKYKLFSNSFSKYGSEFYNYLILNRKDDVACLNPYLTSQAHQ